jgi:hypothetical protein
MGMHKLDAILHRARALEPPKSARPPPVSRADWEEAVGSRIARRAQPMRLDRGVMYVKVANAAWANELSMLADDILRQLKARGLPVESLRFSVGRIDAWQSVRRTRQVHTPAPPNAQLPEVVKEKVSSVEDDELARAIAAAAAKSLAIGGE